MPEKWTSVSFPLTNLFPARIFITLIQTYLTSHSSRYTAARFVSSSYCSSGVLATSPPHLQLLTGRCKVYFIKFYCLFWPTEIFVSRFRTFTFTLTFACDLSSFSGLSLLLLSTIRFVFCFFFCFLVTSLRIVGKTTLKFVLSAAAAKMDLSAVNGNAECKWQLKNRWPSFRLFVFVQ